MLVRRLGILDAVVSVSVAVGMGVAFTWAYVRFTAVALWARYTAVLPALGSSSQSTASS